MAEMSEMMNKHDTATDELERVQLKLRAQEGLDNETVELNPADSRRLGFTVGVSTSLTGLGSYQVFTVAVNDRTPVGYVSVSATALRDSGRSACAPVILMTVDF
ncbi:MAG: hypothetical protein WCQ63_04570 [Methanomethylophilus sp.]